MAYKNLLGPNQNMSHVPGADVEAQEINTVADMVNFEMKKKMYRRFSTGFGFFMIAQLCEYGGEPEQSPGGRLSGRVRQPQHMGPQCRDVARILHGNLTLLLVL